MGAHQTMIWYLVTIRDALALITRAPSLSSDVRACARVHTGKHARIHTARSPIYISPDTSGLFRVRSHREKTHECLHVSAIIDRPIHPTDRRISREFFISAFTFTGAPVSNSSIFHDLACTVARQIIERQIRSDERCHYVRRA